MADREMKESDNNGNNEIQWLSQPFLTDEGFVNPACMNELESAIASLPPDWIRLAGDPERITPQWLFVHNICGAFARAAVELSPYAHPPNLEGTLRYLRDGLGFKARRLPPERKSTVDEELVLVSLNEVNKWLHDVLDDFAPFHAWNVPVNKSGGGIVFCDAISPRPDPDDDFIDLDALIMHVCNQLRDDRRSADDFELRFQREHPQFFDEGPEHG